MRHALLLQQGLKLTGLEHLRYDVTAPDKLTLHVKLRDRWPLGVFLDALAQLLLLQHVGGLERHAQVREDLHDAGGEAALREHRGALHVEEHLVSIDIGLDAVEDGIGHGGKLLEDRVGYIGSGGSGSLQRKSMQLPAHA